ncbi:MAG: polymer-forming cytoskeletal protein [Burkholderiaceae bacterium]|nr:polymer-forming cytoskeletal protein [Burkholderiaceae bacterium]
MFGKKAIAQEIGSLIGAGTTVIGDVNFTGGLRVDGVVRGAVRCTDTERGGMLVVSEHGSIEGEVRASHIVVSGKIQGPVHAAVLIELQPKARVQGDVQYHALEMHHGAIVEGLMVHIPSDARGAAAKPVPAPPRVEPTAGKIAGRPV